MGERAASEATEVAALRYGLDLGCGLIDTAEMYGEGGAERVVGQAIHGRRDGVFLVSKVYPHNASRRGTIAACERSLSRLKAEYIDLYLLHWRGSYPLGETVEAFERLKRNGKIRDWGVSNFDSDDMAELNAVTGGAACVANQVLYHLGERGVEWALLGECHRANTMVMAYSPLGQGDILGDETLAKVAARHGVSAAAIALAFVMSRPGVVAIPKATRVQHVVENAKATSIRLEPDDIVALDEAFPPPSRQVPLAMI